MRKLPLYTMTAVTAIMMAGTLPLTSQAAVKTYVISGTSNPFASSGNDYINEIRAQLEGLGINCDQMTFSDMIQIPGISLPGVIKPEVPDFPLEPDTEGKPPQEDNNDSSFAQQVVNLVNEERAKAGLSPLTINHQAAAAAEVRAREIERSFSHTRPDGSNFHTVLTQHGVNFRGSGENIAYGQKTPQEVMNGWMNSAGHRANILNKDFTTIGVGYYQNQAGVGYWTQLFTH